MTDWVAARREFPALATQAYLNTAAGAPMCRAAAAAGSAYYEATAADGDVHWDEWLARVERVRADTGALLGVDAAQIAFLQNASAAMNQVAARLEGRGDVVLVRDDFPSVTYPWLVAGHGVSFAEPDQSGGASLDALAAAVRPSTRILALGLVHYRSGYRYDLEELSAFCSERELILVVDSTQSLGAIETNLAATPVDFMVCSGYKWLTAGYGFGILHVADRYLGAGQHVAAGWRSAVDPYALVADQLDLSPEAAAIELGHPPFAAVFALGEALRMMADLGAGPIEQRVLELATGARAVLAAAGLEVRGDQLPRSGIVFAEAPEPVALRDELLKRGVYVSARGSGIRVSTHFYNDESDLERLADALADLAD